MGEVGSARYDPSDLFPFEVIFATWLCHDTSLEICTPRYEATLTFSRGSFFRVYTVTIGSSFLVILMVLHLEGLKLMIV